MTPIARLLIALSAPAAFLACATGAPPLGGEAVGDGGSVGDNSYGTGGGDGGSDASKKDAGSGTGTLPTDDAGSGSGGSGSGGSGGGSGASGDFCTGSTSSYDGDTYDDWCDNDSTYVDETGFDFACASNSDCAGYSLPFCCFKPKASDICTLDYGGQPQCVPQ